jgi:hypothetical protein
MLLFILWRDTTSELWTLVQFPLHCYYCFTFTCLFTFLHTITFYHSIRSILCLQETGEIDNLIVSWGKVLGCVVCRFHVVAGEEAPTSTTHQYSSGAVVRSVAKLASINLRKFGFLLLV